MGSRIKSLIYLLPILMMSAVAQEPSSQPLIVKRFSDKSLGGECVLLSAQLDGDRNVVTKSFVIEVPVAGQYYLHAWGLSVSAKTGTQNPSVFIDDQKASSGVLEFVDFGWQSAPLVESHGKTSKAILLLAGKHTISFKCEGPSTPAIDFIRLSRLEPDARIPNDKYREFRERVAQSRLPGNYGKIKADSSARRLLRTVGNPEGEYLHELELGFSYTYYHMFYWAESGSQVTFETKKADPYASDPVMEFFNAEDPVNKGSWVDDDGGDGYQAKLTVTIPYSGTYYLLIWSYGVGTSGTSDLYLNGNLFAADIPLTHTGVRHEFSNSEELNYFTAWLTGDSRIWIEDQDGLPGKIRAYNDDFGYGAFSWGYNARVRKSLSMSIGATQLSAYSSSNPTGECDLYMKCGSIGYFKNDFENLDSMDAVRSAPSDNAYNCASWSGGITSSSEWPPNYGSRWNDGNQNHQDTLDAWDNFYGNINSNGDPELRYSGSERWTYTNVGATSSNNQIDLWVNDLGKFTHASVNSRWDNISFLLPADSNAHGYDWESKHGSDIRFFHPRSAIGGDPGYGQIASYYKLEQGMSKRGSPLITSSESVRRGLSVLEEVRLTNDEQNRIHALKESLAPDDISTFGFLYAAWRKTWSNPAVSMYSDPRKYAESHEYSELLNWCVTKGRLSLLLLLERMNDGDFFVIVPLEDLAYAGNENLMGEVRTENKLTRYTSDGKYIMHSLFGNWMKFGKKLLARFDNYQGFAFREAKTLLGKTETTGSNSVIIQSYPNPFNPSTQIRYRIPSKSQVTVKIYDLLGKEMNVIVDKKTEDAGWHVVNWSGVGVDGRPVSSGAYFCRVIVDNHVQTIRLIVVR